MLNVRFQAALLLLSVALVGCGRIEKSDVIGRYVANHGHGVETLELLPNGEYILTYNGQETPSFENRSVWEFEYTDRGTPRITFAKYIFGYRDEPFVSRGPGYWSVRPTRTVFGGIGLVINSDLGYYFYKE